MKIIFAKDAWEFLKKDSSSLLIDVRTEEEWRLIGFPDISSLGKETIALTWKAGEEDAFIKILKEKVKDKATPLLFLCRSGSRSHSAGLLAAQYGYSEIINILDGFEDKHGSGMGWRDAGLPYISYPQK